MTARRQSLLSGATLGGCTFTRQNRGSKYVLNVGPGRGAKRGAYGICLKLIYRARFSGPRRSQRSVGGVLGAASLAASTALSHVLSEGAAAAPWRPWSDYSGLHAIFPGCLGSILSAHDSAFSGRDDDA